MTFKFLRAKLNGDPNIGFYGLATDDYCLLGSQPNKTFLTKIENTLKTKVKITTVTGTELIGLFAAGNTKGIILPKIAEEHEVEKIKKMLGINVLVLKSRQTALGNMLVCNDSGCLIPESLKKFNKEIADVLDCDVEIGTVAGLDIIGSSAVANNRGCLCHREATDEEMKKIKSLLKVNVDVGTAGYGSPFIRSSIIVNSNGIVFSELSTGPEIGRFEEVCILMGS